MTLYNAAQEALQKYHAQHQERTDRLVTTLRDVVVGYQQEGSAASRFQAIETVLKGRDTQLLEDCEAHLTYAGNNFAPFMWKFYKSHRATIMRLLKLLPLQALGSDPRLAQALAFMLEHERTRSEWVTVLRKEPVASQRKDPPIRLFHEVPLLDLSWIPSGWWRLVTDLTSRGLAPQRINRRHFEACVVSQFLTALNNGDLFVAGADRFGNPLPRLFSWDEYHARVEDYCQHLGIPADPTLFVQAQQQWLTKLAEEADHGFPANTHLSIKDGRPSLRRLRRQPDPPGLKDLRRLLEPPTKAVRHILEALIFSDYWLNWTRCFGPLSGFESKLDNPAAHYLIAVFCYGTGLGPTATARAVGLLDRRQISRIDQHHIVKDDLTEAIALIANGYQRCSLPQLWGSPAHASIDGTKWELYEQNLLSEQHIRYGGYGGIALTLVSSTYIALMVNLIACSAWEGHYLLDVLEENRSVIQPTVIHTDTQGQNEAIFGLSFLRGIELMPRIRDWQDLTFYRPTEEATYTHIDELFSQKAINWDLIRTHLPDLLRIALSIKEGRILPSTILRTLSAGSSQLAQACRELGRARRTGFLLRYITKLEVRALIHKETNKVESFHQFSKWLGFGAAGVIRSNERPAQQKALKYNLLLANAVMFYNTVTLANDLRALVKRGYAVTPECVAALSPYSTKYLDRIGKILVNLEEIPEPVDYVTPVVSVQPEAEPADLVLVEADAGANDKG